METVNTPGERSVGDNEVKYRECDDMLARRLTGNIPSHLKKAKEDSHKKFITPTSNPMQYVREHKKSQMLNELEEEKAIKKKEQKERDVRYEEIQGVKSLLKEEESVWTSKLDNWKQRRRSATFDVRQRSEERRSIMIQQAEPATPRRRAKTFREMVEDKKKRDAGIYSDDHFSSSFLTDFSNDESQKYERTNSKKLYLGAASVPMMVIRNNEIASTVEQSSPVERPVPLAQDGEIKEDQDTVNTSALPLPLKPTSSLTNAVPSVEHAKESRFPSSDLSLSIRNTNHSNNKPSFLRNSFQTSAEIQNKKAKRLSAPVFKTHIHTSAVRHSISTTSESSEDDTSPTRNLPVSGKRSLWENMAAYKVDKPAQSVPIDLSTLLQQDEERLQIKGSSQDSFHSENSSQASSSDVQSEQLHKPKPNNDEAVHLVHKPKIMAPNYNRNDILLSRHDPQHTQHTFEPIHKYGNAPAIKGSITATLPSKPRISSVEEKVIKLKEQENSLRLNISGLKGPVFSPRRSPRGPLDSLFEDLNISINQQPKCERGFGFTVRGGDDGRPVVVNTVSAGGAADSCHLQVGDEVLAINDVRLSDTLTQDDIVQLIVNSVITGKLSLNVRRYGKSKKATPRPFLGSGSGRLNMAGGAFPVHFNKRKAAVTSKPSFNHVKEDPVHDFPPPPPDLNLHTNHSNGSQPLDSQNKAHPPHDLRNGNQFMTSQPKCNNSFSGKDNGRGSGVGRLRNGAPRSNGSHSAATAKLPLNVIEWTPSPHEAQQTEVKHRNHIEPIAGEDEAKREDEKRKRIEEALAEERRITEQLRKIEAAKLEQQRRRVEEKRKFLTAPNSLYNRIFNNPGLNVKDGEMLGKNGGKPVTSN